jgi:hypothetical protein
MRQIGITVACGGRSCGGLGKQLRKRRTLFCAQGAQNNAARSPAADHEPAAEVARQS